MDTEDAKKSPEIDATEKNSVPDVIRQISEIQVPFHIIENIDVKSIGQRFAGLFEELDEAQENFKELNSAGIIKKFCWAVSGKTTEIMLDAQQIQAELAKLQSTLIMLNTVFAKELTKQQSLILKQQKTIEEQNSEISKHQDELVKQNKKIVGTQDTILKLVKLTNEQEEVLKELFSRADYIRDIEKKFSKHISSITSNINEIKTENEKSSKSLKDAFDNSIECNMKKLMSHLEGINEEVAAAKDDLESLYQSNLEEKEHIHKSIDNLRDENNSSLNNINNRFTDLENSFNHKVKNLKTKGLIAIGVNICIIIGIVIIYIFGK